jgi:hypothetical protein
MDLAERVLFFLGSLFCLYSASAKSDRHRGAAALQHLSVRRYFCRTCFLPRLIAMFHIMLCLASRQAWRGAAYKYWRTAARGHIFALSPLPASITLQQVLALCSSSNTMGCGSSPIYHLHRTPSARHFRTTWYLRPGTLACRASLPFHAYLFAGMRLPPAPASRWARAHCWRAPHRAPPLALAAAA